MEYVVVFWGCALGCGLNLVCGFGFGVFCMMFLPYVMNSAMEAAALVNIITLCQAVCLVLRYRKHVAWRLAAAPLASYFVFSWLAVRFASGLANDALRLALGVCLLVLSMYFIFAAKRVRVKGGAASGLIAGGLGGVMSGLFSIGGPPMSLYFSAATEEKEQYLATIQAYYMFSNSFVICLRAANGVVTRNVLVCALAGLAGMALGTLLGNTVFQRLKAETLRKAIYTMMSLSGAVMVCDALL